MPERETPEQKEAGRVLDQAVHEYLRLHGEVGDGAVLTNWGLCYSATKMIDGEPAYSTGSSLQPGGIPTYTWVGIMQCELKKWISYFTEYSEDEDG